MRRLALSLFCLLTLTGCAKVQVQPLKADGTRSGAVPGVRYYLPMPYLLVTELPVAETAPALPPAKAQPAPGGAPAKEDAPDPGGSPTATSPAGASNTSFSAATPQYVLKLIYLPDLEHPMALTASSGFGTAQMTPTLQDGWMLTSLSASSDSKVAETLTALGSALTGLKGPAAGAKAPGGGPDPYQGTHCLAPGLYRFAFDPLTGKFQGLQTVDTFVSGRVVPAP